MKKIIAILMATLMVLAFAACGTEPVVVEDPTEEATTEVTEEVTEVVEEVKVMSYDEFAAAELQSEVVVETYVQAKQSWWEKDGVGVATFYTQNEDGAYFLYEMPCSKDDFDNKLTTGAKIRVTGFKAEWAGEVEIIDAKYELLEGNYVAEAIDLTDKLCTDELVSYQNRFAAFKGLVVEKVEYKNGEPGDDIYVDLGFGGNTYSFCIERYLTAPDTDVYAAVGALEVGDIVNVECFVYWYNGINPHITAITVADEF